MEFKFSDDNQIGSAVTRGPSVLEVIDNIRSPSPDFDFEGMDDLIRAAPDSILDADNYSTAVDLTVDDVEEVPSAPDVSQVSQKRLRDSSGPAPTAKRMRRISDWQSDTGRRMFGPVRSDSAREVGVLDGYHTGTLLDVESVCRLSARLSNPLLHLCSSLGAAMGRLTIRPKLMVWLYGLLVLILRLKWLRLSAQRRDMRLDVTIWRITMLVPTLWCMLRLRVMLEQPLSRTTLWRSSRHGLQVVRWLLLIRCDYGFGTRLKEPFAV